jgi:hypothetical protein
MPVDRAGRYQAESEMEARMTAAFEIREIDEDDLTEVVALLCDGFPRSTPTYWQAGLKRLARRERPPLTEKYGYVIAAENRLRGVVLTIPSVHQEGLTRRVYTNISSWYMQPAFRGPPAKELYRYATRHEGVTYTNLSAATHTIKTIKSFGFQEWTAGQMVAVGVRRYRSPLGKVRFLSPDKLGNSDCSAEANLLADHENFGCLTFCLETANRLCPFIFVRRHVRRFIPCAQLIYCRDLTDLVQHGLAISSWLTMRGFPLMLIDASGPIEGLIGYYIDRKNSKYFKGPRPVKAHDHTYSEMALFGF